MREMKKIIALLLSLLMTFNMTVEAVASSGISDSLVAPESEASGENIADGETTASGDVQIDTQSSDGESVDSVGDSVEDYGYMPMAAGEQYSYTNGELVASGSLFGSTENSWELYSDSTLYILHNKDEAGSWPMQRRNGAFWKDFNASPWCEAAAPYAPLTVVIQQGFNEVGEGLLFDDSTVGTLVIPDSVTRITEQAAHGATELKKVIWTGDRSDKTVTFEFLAFCDSGLEEVELPPNSIINEKQVFADCVNLKKLTIPGYFGKLGESCCNWILMNSECDSVYVEEGVTDIDYYDAFTHSSINNLYLPESLINLEYDKWIYEEIKLNPDMIVWGTPGSIAEQFAKDMHIRFNGEYIPTEVTLNPINDPLHAGEFLTDDKCTVNWYNADTGTLIGSGHTVTITPDINLEYEIVFTDDEYIHQYYNTRERVNLLQYEWVYDAVAPQSRDTVKLRVEVENPELADYHDYFDFTLTQTWGENGIKKSEGKIGIGHTFSPDSDTVFPLFMNFDYYDIKIDFDTEITFSPEGYLPMRLHYYPGELAELEDYEEGVKLIKIKFIPDKISTQGDLLLNIKESEPALPGEEPMVYAMDSSRIIKVSVGMNGRTTEYEDMPKYPYIPIGKHSAGDRIEVTVSYSAEDSDAILSLHDFITVGEDGSAVFDATIPRKGYIQSTRVLGASEVMVSVFGGSGNPIYSDYITSAFKTSQLNEGWYEVIFMEKNDIFNGLASKADLTRCGLVEGVDYVCVPKGVDVKDGVISDIGEITVPHFDSSRFTVVDHNNSSVTPGYSTMTVGGIQNIRVEYAVSDNYPSDTLDMFIDFDCVEVDENSLTLNGEPLDAGHIDVLYGLPLSGILRFQIRGVSSGSGGVSISVSDGRGGFEYLGGSKTDIASMTLNAVKKTARKTIPLSGRAVSNCEVGVYDNGVLIGTSKTNALGDWKLNYELNPKNNYEIHEFNARIISDDWRNGLSSKSTIVEYSDKFIDVSKVSLVGKDIVFDYNNPSHRNVIVLLDNDGMANNTYLIEFTKNPEKASNVKLNVFNEDGTFVQTDAVYDASLGGWVATAYSLPRNVGVEFDQEVEIELDDIYGPDSEIDLEERWESIDNASDMLSVGDPYLSEDGTAALFDLTCSSFGSEPIGQLVMTPVDIAQYNESEMKDLSFAYEDGSWYRYTVSSDGLVYTAVDFENKLAFDITLGMELLDVREGIDEAAPISAYGIALTSMDSERDAGRVMLDAIEQFGGYGTAQLAAFFDYKTIIKTQEWYNNMALDSISYVSKNLDIVCPDTGKFRLSDSQRNVYLRDYRSLLEKIYKSDSDFNNAMDIFYHRYVNSYAFEVLTLGLGKILKNVLRPALAEAKLAMKECYTLWVRAGFYYELSDYTTVAKVLALMCAHNSDKILKDVMSYADVDGVWTPDNQLPDEVGGLFDCTDIALGPYWGWLKETYLGSGGLIDRANNLNDSIVRAIASSQCTKPEPPLPMPFVAFDQSPCQDANYIRDPSGYVCEAVASNRLEGVKAEAYYDAEGYSETLWDAEEYGQQNPLYTDSDGRYAWFVPNGNWRVKFEKEGYVTEWSDWVTVPPVQTEVNAALVSTASPAVKYVTAYNDSVRIEFTQYMDVDTVSGTTVTVNSNGKALTGTLKPLNAENGFDNPTAVYASVYEFVPSTDISGSVTVSVNGAYSYNGKPITGYESDSVRVMIRAEKIIVTPAKTIVYGEDDYIEVSLLPETAYGYTLTVKSQIPEIADVAKSSYTFTSAGETIKIPVSGILPGETVIEYELDGTGLTSSTVLTVALSGEKAEECADVVANPDSGTYPAGTKITLSTETPGASIYYTLDKTCPCITDSPSRILYTGPITLTEEMYIIAYAVKDGFEDSATKGYHYTVSEYDCDSGVHKWNNGVVTKEPSCTKAGERLYTCELCGKTKTEPEAATGHKPDTEFHSDADSHWHICLNKNCDAENNIIDVEAHKEASDYKYDENSHWHYCEVCGYDEYEKVEHNSEKSIKCSAAGHWYECDTCGAVFDYDPHSEAVFIPAVEATKEADGYLAHWYCPDCYSYFYDNNGEIGAGPYDESEFTVKYNPGCDGNHLLVCVPVNEVCHMVVCQRQCGFVLTLQHNFGFNGICVDCGYAQPVTNVPVIGGNVTPALDITVTVETPTEGKIACEEYN